MIAFPIIEGRTLATISTLYEHYSGSYNFSSTVYGSKQVAEIITVGPIAHTINSITFIPYRTGRVGPLYVTLETVVNGQPSGVVLSQCVVDNIPQRRIVDPLTVSVPTITVPANSQYALRFSLSSGDGNTLVCIYSASTTTYSDGYLTYTTDDGATWNSYSASDIYFQVWGAAL